MSALLGLLGLGSISSLLGLMAAAGAAATIIPVTIDGIVKYMLLDRACNTAVDVTDRIMAGKQPVQGFNPNDYRRWGMAKEEELRRTLEDEYRLVPVQVVAVGKDAVIAQISVDTGKRLSENDVRYLSSRIGAAVAVAYVKVCTNCGAVLSAETVRCSDCGAQLTSRQPVSPFEPVVYRPPPVKLTEETRSSENVLDLLGPTEHLVVDGSNLATGPGDVGHVWTLQKVLEQMDKAPGRCTVFVGSALWRKVDDEEAFNKLSVEHKVSQTPRGFDDDDTLLYEANVKNAVILTNDVYDKTEAFDERDPRYESEAMVKVRERVAKYPWLRDKTRFITHVRIFEEKRIIFHRKMPREQGPPGPLPTEPPTRPPRDLSRETQQLEEERCPKCGGKMEFVGHWDGQDWDGKPAGGPVYFCPQCKATMNLTYHGGGTPRPGYKQQSKTGRPVDKHNGFEVPIATPGKSEISLPEQEDTRDIPAPPPLQPIIQVPRAWKLSCHTCGNMIQAGDYCNQCGAPLVEDAARPIDDTCTECGGVVDRWTLLCNRCGTRFESWVCDVCNSPLEKGAERCATCGSRLAWRR
jgi:rRNA maturation endonuclease Nob1